MSHKCDPCRFRNKSSKAIYLCETCMEYYCSRCRKQHLKFRLTIGHLVTEVGDKKESRKSGKVLSQDTGLRQDHGRYNTGNIEPNSGIAIKVSSCVLFEELNRNMIWGVFSKCFCCKVN